MAVAKLDSPLRSDFGHKVASWEKRHAAGYCDNSAVLDKALTEWAESYGDQTEQDHATLVDSIKRGKTKAHIEGTDGS